MNTHVISVQLIQKIFATIAVAALVLSTFAFAPFASADDRSITVGSVSITVCGTQDVQISGSAHLHPENHSSNKTDTLGVYLNGDLIHTDLYTRQNVNSDADKNVVWSEELELTPGSYTVLVTISDKDSVVKSDSINFTILECPGTITIQKTVVNDDEGTAVADDFTFRINGDVVSHGVAIEVAPGAYTVSEDAFSGYTAGDWGEDCAADGSITVMPGEDYVCTVTNDDDATEEEGNEGLGAASISGKKIDGDTEAGIGGWTIFIDENDNGILDGGEKSTVTDSEGNYIITHLLPNVGQNSDPYVVCEVQQMGWTQVFPVSDDESVNENDCYVVTIEPGPNKHVTGYDFVNVSNDGGDDNGGGDDNDEEVDTYIIRAYVWHDRNRDGVMDNNERRLAGWTVQATNGEDTYSVQTNADGLYELEVPEGTWTVSLQLQNRWRLVSTANASYVITVPAEEDEEDENILAMIKNFFIPTAHAAVLGEYEGENFTVLPVSSGSGSSAPSDAGEILGESTSVEDEGEVLGEATSIMPYGAPDTGAGGTSPVSPVLPTLSALFAGVMGTRRMYNV